MRSGFLSPLTPQLSALISDSVTEIKGVCSVPPSSLGHMSALSASLGFCWQHTLVLAGIS